MKTFIQEYSLAKNEVGKLIGEPIITPYKNGTEALLALDKEMNSRSKLGSGFFYFIQFEDGRKLAFDGAYRLIFGKSPIYRDNKSTLYPELQKP